LGSKAAAAWAILTKPAVRGQLTLEVACRVRAAILRMRELGEVPGLVCFCGSELVDTPAKAHARERRHLPTDAALADGTAHVSGAQLAYSFFRACADAQSLDVSGVRFVLHDGVGARAGLERLAMELQSLEAQRVADSKKEHSRRSLQPVLLFSTEHHLHRMQDVDTLLPRASLLRPLDALQAAVAFEYVNYPHAYLVDKAMSRKARRVLQAEQLQVLQLNLQGMLRSHELFEPEVWNRVADIRSKLCQELLRGDARSKPSARKRQKDPQTSGRQISAHTSIVEIEAMRVAVGSLGRVQCILRPIAQDPLRSVLAVNELEEAQELLHSAVSALRATDPDRPLQPREWTALVSGARPLAAAEAR